MNRIITYTINQLNEPLTVGMYLRNLGYSRHVLAALKREDHGIVLNSMPVFTSRQLSCGDTLTIRLPLEKPSDTIVPVPMDLSIVYEDEDILVINKPADMPVHPSIGNYANTLANGIAWYYQQKGISAAFHCINRLDRDTTGLLVLAKHMLSACVLSAQMRNRSIHRTYLALVSGVFSEPVGTINEPIARVDESVIMRCVRADGETAVTHYRVIQTIGDISLVALRLDTGRTHQIRVHMTHIGHPLLGDFLYNPNDRRCTRQTLHSHTLRFTHPVTGKPLSFTAELPLDMAALIPSESLEPHQYEDID